MQTLQKYISAFNSTFDLNNIKTKSDFDIIFSTIQILPEKIITHIENIYHKEIKSIVFNGKDRSTY